MTDKPRSSSSREVGKPERGDPTRSSYDFSLVRALIRRGGTDVKDLAAALMHRPNGSAWCGDRRDASGWLTIANALIRK